jgi:hypothetical protein
MWVLPIENRGLLVLGGPVSQYRDKERNEPATDRDTGAPLVEVTVALTVEGGQPQVLRVSLPQPGVPKDLAVGQMVRPTGLTMVAGEKNGRAWQIFRATSLAVVKSG